MIKRTLVIVYTFVALTLAGVLVVLSLTPAYNVLYYFNPLHVVNEVEYSVNGTNRGRIELPYTVTDLKPGDKVSVYLSSSGRDQDNLLIKIEGAHCALSVDGDPYFSVGNSGTYPSYQKEPPRSIDMVALPSVNAGTELRLDYTISAVGSSLELSPYYSGDQNLLTKQVLMENYVALALALAMLVAGITISIIGLVFYSRAPLAIVFFWLGLACLACGGWSLFANDTILLFFSQFSAFYTTSFVGLFILPIPLARFCISFIKPYRSRLLDTLFIIICAAFVAIMVSHVSGFISFGQVEPYFKIVGTLLLVFYVFFVVWIRQRHRVVVSPLFILGIALFMVLAVFDVASDYLGVASPTGTFFMVGLFFATIVIALLVSEYLSDALDALEKNARLEADISAINRSLDLQRKHFQDFASSMEETRRIRHDLRHQLVAIQGFINENKDKEALEYIDDLSKTIPSMSEMLICDNVAVNSLAVHYKTQAEAEDIQCDIKMDVPFAVGRIPDGDLAIIVGNLFENALEACTYVEPEKRFIRIRAHTDSSRFTLTIDNSFDGVLNVNGNEFYSRKRNGYGVGIASVRSVVSKYDGSMKYETEPGVFKTSLYVKI